MRPVICQIATRGVRIALVGAVATAATFGVLVATASSAAAYPPGCSKKTQLDESDVLRPGRALCNGDYLLRMQENGDLVLRHIPTGRACWHSKTFQPGASVTFTPGGGKGPFGTYPPYLRIGAHKIPGGNDFLDMGRNTNLTSKGELWVGYDIVAWCKKGPPQR